MYNSGTLVFNQNGLTAGPHTFKLVVQAAPSASSTGTRVEVDAFLVIAP